MRLLETAGLRGAPAETLRAIEAALKGLDLARSQVVLVTDWQDHRRDQRYGVMVVGSERVLISAGAFGPHFGAAGREALAAVVRGLSDRGALNFKESVIAPHEFGRVFDEPSLDDVRRLLSNANPVDPLIYLE